MCEFGFIYRDSILVRKFTLWSIILTEERMSKYHQEVMKARLLNELSSQE